MAANLLDNLMSRRAVLVFVLSFASLGASSAEPESEEFDFSYLVKPMKELRHTARAAALLDYCGRNAGSAAATKKLIEEAGTQGILNWRNLPYEVYRSRTRDLSLSATQYSVGYREGLTAAEALMEESDGFAAIKAQTCQGADAISDRYMRPSRDESGPWEKRQRQSEGKP